ASIGLLLFAATAGCKPGVGDACEKGNVTCVDGKNAVVCQSSKYVAVPCKGANGCAGEKAAATCDASGNAAGDACSTDEEGSAWCAADSKAKLLCKGGKLAAEPCRGPKGCKGQSCDTSFAEVGDPCVE